MHRFDVHVHSSLTGNNATTDVKILHMDEKTPIVVLSAVLTRVLRVGAAV